MRYGSVCSGVEAATVAWDSLGWEPAFYSEIENFPRAVLKHHYPDVPLHGDFTTIGENQYGSIDLLVGGTPCQSFSIAGLRKGLDDDRGNLALEFIKLAQRERPQWMVWENVPGVLSSNGGRDFGSFLGAMVELGYGFAYRICDAQYWGVAQRRRRVFVVGYLGDWRPPAAVLFERESLSGNPPPSREARKDAPGSPADCSGGRSWPADVTCTINAAYGAKQGLEDQHALGGASLFVPQVVGPLTAGMCKGPRGTESVDSNHVLAFPSAANVGGMGAIGRNISPTMLAGESPLGVAFAQNTRNELRESDVIGALSTGGGKPGQGYPAVRAGMQVRRLSPVECERLQGFPDDYTKIPYRNKSAEDCPLGARYKAMGNSMAVPVMHWIGKRIEMVSKAITNGHYINPEDC